MAAAKYPGAQQVRLGEYQNLKAARRMIPVLSQDVENELLILRRRAAVWVPTDQPAARRDRVTVSCYAQFADGAPVPDSGLEGYELVLGSGKLMPGAEAALEGRRAGEEIQFPFTYPEGFRVEALRGETVRFTVLLQRVLRQQLPAADDAFARTQGAETLDALRQKIYTDKTARHEKNAEEGLAENLLAQVAAGLCVQWQPGYLDGLAAAALGRLSGVLQKSGVTLEQYCAQGHTTVPQLQFKLRQEEEARARRSFAVRALAEAERLTPTPEEVQAALAALEAQGKRHKALTEQAMADAMTYRAVLDWLVSHAGVILVEEKR